VKYTEQNTTYEGQLDTIHYSMSLSLMAASLFPDSSFRPDTADEEVYRIQRGGGDRSPAPSLAVTEGDYGAPASQPKGRSTLQG